MLTYNYPLLNPTQCRNYLERIGLNHRVPDLCAPSLDFLNQLIDAHQKTVPFENLDVYLEHLPISLSPSDLYHKIVEEHRGGYCFELNGLFVLLLRSLGFDATSCFCRVVRGNDRIRAISHRGNIVRLEDGLYFCDVGFGGPMPRGAVRIWEGEHQFICGEEFWMEDQKNGWWNLLRLRRGTADDFDPDKTTGSQIELMISPVLADPMDFEAMNLALSTNPESLFRRVFMSNLNTDDGYVGIQDFVFTEKKNGVTKKKAITAEEREELLRRRFGIG